MRPVIYRIDFPNGDFYVGATSDFSKRRRQHLAALRSDKHSTASKLTSALRQHGMACIYAVATGFTKESVHELEAQYIQLEQPTLNTNLAPSPLPSSLFKGESNLCKPFGGHKSLKAAAKALGASYTSLKRWYKQDITWPELEERLQKRLEKSNNFVKLGPQDPRKNSRLVRLSIGWFKRTDVQKVPSETVRDRLARGWSFDEAVTTPPKAPRPGVATRVCTKYKVQTATYYYRRTHGWTVYQALGLQPRPNNRRTKVKQREITAGGQTLTLKAWAKKAGVSPGVIHSRLSNGWTNEQAVGLEKTPYMEKVEANKKQRRPSREKQVFTIGDLTGTVAELSRASGIPGHVIYARKKLGWPTEDWLQPVGSGKLSKEERVAAIKAAIAPYMAD